MKVVDQCRINLLKMTGWKDSTLAVTMKWRRDKKSRRDQKTWKEFMSPFEELGFESSNLRDENCLCKASVIDKGRQLKAILSAASVLCLYKMWANSTSRFILQETSFLASLGFCYIFCLEIWWRSFLIMLTISPWWIVWGIFLFLFAINIKQWPTDFS